MELYPLLEKHPNLIAGKTGKKLSDISIDKVIDGSLGIEDLSISADTLMLQAKVALDSSRPQLAENFVRASELIAIPDDEILSIYNALALYFLSKLLAIADSLDKKYKANVCAAFIRETTEVYKKRGILRRN